MRERDRERERNDGKRESFQISRKQVQSFVTHEYWLHNICHSLASSLSILLSDRYCIYVHHFRPITLDIQNPQNDIFGSICSFVYMQNKKIELWYPINPTPHTPHRIQFNTQMLYICTPCLQFASSINRTLPFSLVQLPEIFHLFFLCVFF